MREISAVQVKNISLNFNQYHRPDYSQWNGYGWIWMDLDGFGWIWMGLDGLRWIWMALDKFG